jgi:hypothetical protein
MSEELLSEWPSRHYEGWDGYEASAHLGDQEHITTMLGRRNGV